MASIAVVGAGMVGSSTADLLRSRLPASTEITLIADKFNSDTTSWGAAGIFRINDCDCVEPEKLDRWLTRSFDHYHSLTRSSIAPKIGASVVKLYHLFSHPNPSRPMFTHYSYDYRPLSKTEMKYMKVPPHCQTGCLVSTVMIEPRYYVPFLVDSFSKNGGIISKRRLSSWSDLQREFDVVINCSGAGARTLCQDHRLFPVRGQVVRVKAPWLRHAYVVDEPDTYLYPGRDFVALGGIREVGNWSEDVSEADTDTILRRSLAIEPSLVHAQIEEVWAGVRPCRDEIRVEIDLKSCDIPIVHNYGHGGSGILLGYATAEDAVELTKEVLKAKRHKL